MIVLFQQHSFRGHGSAVAQKVDRRRDVFPLREDMRNYARECSEEVVNQFFRKESIRESFVSRIAIVTESMYFLHP